MKIGFRGEKVMSDIESRLVRNIVETKYEDIPDEVFSEKKKNILDILGIMIAGTNAQGCANLVDLIGYWGGCHESSILGHGFKTSLYNATIANCTMARALDFDDVFREKTTHVNVTVVPVGLSVAEKEGNINGKDFLTAITLGADLESRLALASTISTGLSGMSFTYQFATFGAAAVAGKMMKLNNEQMTHAIGIAYSQMAGNNQCIIDSALTVRLQQGLSAGSGVLSAILAQRGITGALEPFMGKFGYYNVYQRGGCNVDALTSDLGAKFEGVYHAIKPYPCCMHTHAAIDAIREIQSKAEIDIREIDEVEVRINEAAYNITCHPLEEKRTPKTVVEAQFSMPYVVASALVKGHVFLDNFTEKEISRPGVLELAREKIKPQIDQQINQVDGGGGITQTELKIKMRGGDVYQAFVEFPKGSPQKPMTIEDCIEKFSRCSQMGVKPLTQEKSKRAVDMVLNIEKLSNVNELISLIVQ
jgi:2-methylcitrate dehydratase PrpD